MDILKRTTEFADGVLDMANWMMKRLESPGRCYKSADALGSLAEVCAVIEPGRTGEIVVEMNGTLQHYPAKAMDESEQFERGAKVKVVDLVTNVMYVESWTSSKDVAEIIG